MNSGKFTREEILYTYRKVKRELFYEKESVSLQRIVDFEGDFEKNIESIIEALETGNSDYFIKKEHVGKSNFVFKKAKCKVNGNLKVNKTIENFNSELISIEYVTCRYMADVSIVFQIIGGLWLNRIGYKLDGNFPDNLYGCRMKSFDEALEDIPYYKQNHTLFKPYFSDYKSWQNDLFDTIDRHNKKNVLVITTDLEKYYHSIKINPLKKKLEHFINDSSIELSGEDEFLNDVLFKMIERFNSLNNKYYKSFFPSKRGVKSSFYSGFGLPLTLNVSRFLSNIYLLDFDMDIIKNVKPLYYGRYVDDIILAVEYDSNIKLEDIKLDVVLEPLTKYKIEDHKLSLNTTSENEFLKFNNEKENQFIFNGENDKVELKQLKKSINDNSSEWKLLPTTDSYDDVEDIDLFYNINKDCEESSGIRKTNGLILKRNKFVREIINFETSISTSNQIVWKKRLYNFLTVTYDYIFDIENFVDLNKFVPRLFGLLIHVSDSKLIDKYFHTLRDILEILQENSKFKNEVSVACVFLKQKVFENIICCSPLNKELDQSIIKNIGAVLAKEIKTSLVKGYFNCDLHLEPYKNCYFKFEEYVKCLSPNISNNYDELLKSFFLTETIIEFVTNNLHSSECENDCETCENDCNKIFESTGFYFYTRRISLLELSVAFKNKVIDIHGGYESFRSLAKIVYYHKLELDIKIGIPSEDGNRNEGEYIYVNFSDFNNERNPVISNTHFETKLGSFDAWVRGLNEPDIKRQDRLIELVNKIIDHQKIAERKIDYLVFHELSLPRKLYLQIATKLSYVKINLISGLEYRIDRINKKADNQLLYCLKVNNQLGSGSVALYQSKNIGAIHENKEIFDRASLVISPKCRKKLIINHGNFVFSGMICNDLLDVNNRSPLRGNIDCLFIIAWNQDLETYHHLVKSATLDLHCFVSLCNNKDYGDTRLCAPYKNAWERDIHKIHGGDIDN